MCVRFEPSCGYEKIHQAVFKGQTATAWVSRELGDPCWDRFLQECPLGQFQQSTMWARAKEPGGWRPLRVVLTLDDKIVGGFQILWRLRWWGAIGYLSKGPVVSAQHMEMADYTVELLRKVCRDKGLRALVVQPPDSCEQMAPRLMRCGCLSGVPVGVSMATWIFDLRDGLEAVELRMGRQTRRKVRQAVSRGVSIREGGRQDLESFFYLMLSTCKRQRVSPNPPDLQHLLALWDAARPSGCIRLIFAHYDGKPLSGLICITFGKTFTLWKRGWNGMEGARHPNELITSEALKMAVQNGYDYCDYAAFDERMARAVQKGCQLSPEQERSRNCFIMHFGGMPRLLPQALLYFPNPFLQSAFSFFHKITGRGRRGSECGGMADSSFQNRPEATEDMLQDRF